MIIKQVERKELPKGVMVYCSVLGTKDKKEEILKKTINKKSLNNLGEIKGKIKFN